MHGKRQSLLQPEQLQPPSCAKSRQGFVLDAVQGDSACSRDTGMAISDFSESTLGKTLENIIGRPCFVLFLPFLFGEPGER